MNKRNKEWAMYNTHTQHIRYMDAYSALTYPDKTMYLKIYAMMHNGLQKSRFISNLCSCP